MRFATGAFCFLQLASIAAARRTKDSELALLVGEEAASHSVQPGEAPIWCTDTDKTVACEEGQTIHIRTAMYNRQQGEDCMSPADAREEVQCSPRAMDSVRDCEGKQECSIPASSHHVCPENPFTYIRLRYVCAGGEAKPSPLTAETVEAAISTATVNTESTQTK